MKDKVLAMLAAAEDYVSGEKISQTLGVSRAAVWKYINKLRSQGYEISSVTNRGYKITAAPDVITAEAVAPYIKTQRIGRNIFFSETIDSTNEEAKRRYTEPDGSLFIAECQTAGKGRRGRSWSSDSGENIYMSLLLKPDIRPDEVAHITPAVGLAVCRAINSFLPEGKSARIKWPNDVVIGAKKVCGILTEMSAEPDHVEYVVCGIGINVNTKLFADDISDKATSMFRETGLTFTRAKIAAAVMNELEGIYDKFLAGGFSAFLSEYKECCVTLGRAVTVVYDKHQTDGIAVDISDGGALIVEIDGERREISAGEASVRGMLGYV